eukprot:12882232-Prorocentrum_lima.AAC.1
MTAMMWRSAPTLSRRWRTPPHLLSHRAPPLIQLLLSSNSSKCATTPSPPPSSGEWRMLKRTCG